MFVNSHPAPKGTNNKLLQRNYTEGVEQPHNKNFTEDFEIR